MLAMAADNPGIRLGDADAPRNLSASTGGLFSVYGVEDLKLADPDGNRHMKIVIATDYSYDGALEIYRFDSNNTFTRVWANTTHPSGSPFRFVEVADLDNNGTKKIIAGNTVAHSGSPGVFIYAYDYPSGAQSWRSVNLGPGSSSVIGLIVQDLNGDNNKEIAALVPNGDLYTSDGPSRQLRNLRQNTDGKVLSNRATASGIVIGDSMGVGNFSQYGINSYTEMFSRQLASRLRSLFLHAVHQCHQCDGRQRALDRREQYARCAYALRLRH